MGKSQPSQGARREAESRGGGSSAAPVFKGRRVLVALTGGIACYKTAAVVSRLVQDGAEVRVMMTKAATRFIGPLTFASLSGKPVVTSVWEADEHHDSPHVQLARWCEVMLIAPASADMIAKLAAGICDDVVSLTAAALPRATPLLLAPAMNADMWSSPVVQRNLATLKDLLGAATIGPESGWQACRTQGAGRMSEAEAIVDAVAQSLINAS